MDKKEIHDRLQDRLDTLQARLVEMELILREPEDDDLEEQAGELDDDEVLACLAMAAREEVKLVRGALERIRNGTYGNCAVCGRAIEKRRLQALLEATTRCGAPPTSQRP